MEFWLKKLYGLFYFWGLLFLYSFISCAPQASPLVIVIDSQDEFGTHIDTIASKMCHKLLVCNVRYYYTLPKEMRKELSQDQCEKNLLENKKKSFLEYDQRMLYELSACYSAILEAPCDKYLEIPEAHPSCIKLYSLLAKKNKASKRSRVPRGE